jgi:RNA polymerase sigma factor (sigma-70 family)
MRLRTGAPLGEHAEGGIRFFAGHLKLIMHSAKEKTPMTVAACDLPTTHWSLVVGAGQKTSAESAAALEALCRAYWRPLYCYVRRLGQNPDDAQDLTQSFFTFFLERKSVRRADRDRGRFRSFLLTSFKNFLTNEWRKKQAEKRGRGLSFISLDLQDTEGRYQAEAPSADLTPDKLFEKRWALALLEQVLARLRAEYEADGRLDIFDHLKTFVWGEKSDSSQTDIGALLGMNANAVAQAVRRLRKRYAELLRAEIANTLSAPGDVEDELRHLLQAVGT